jgi:hypothetical protein
MAKVPDLQRLLEELTVVVPVAAAAVVEAAVTIVEKRSVLGRCRRSPPKPLHRLSFSPAWQLSYYQQQTDNTYISD